MWSFGGKGEAAISEDGVDIIRRESLGTSDGALDKNNESTRWAWRLAGNGKDGEFITLLYRSSIWSEMIYYILSVLTIGIYHVCCLWRPSIWGYVRYWRAPGVQTATHVKTGEGRNTRFLPLNRRVWSNNVLAQMMRNDGKQQDVPDSTELIYFEFDRLRYVYSPVHESFVSHVLTLEQVVNLSNGGRGMNSEPMREALKAFIGENSLEIKCPQIWSCIVEILLRPMNLFQVFSAVIWIAEDYYMYASVIGCLLVGSIWIQAWSLHRSRCAFNEVAQLPEKTEIRLLGNNWDWRMTRTLIPGDVIRLKANEMVPCDALIIEGSTGVDEQKLTGESHVIHKTAYDGKNELPASILYSGCWLTDPRNGQDNSITAVCWKSGYSTFRGQSLLHVGTGEHSRTSGLEGTASLLVGLVAAGIASVILVIHDGVWRNLASTTIALACLDILTIAVPPALPAATSVGFAVAANRLWSDKILCHRLESILDAGQTDIVVFDKTGTLTESWIDVRGFHHVGAREFWTRPEMSLDSRVIHALSVCHALVNDPASILTGSGRVVEASGDPVDVAIHTWSKFHVIDDTVVTSRNECFTILRRYQFTNEKARMAVLCCDENNGVYFVSKGAVGIISKKCKNIDKAFFGWVNDYQNQGFKLLAVAWKKIGTIDAWNSCKESRMDMGINLMRQRRDGDETGCSGAASDSTMATMITPGDSCMSEDSDEEALLFSRDDMENDMEMLGLVVMENGLKPSAAQTVRSLSDCNIDIVMATGDEVGTALAIARKVGILKRDQVVFIGDLEDAKPRWREISNEAEHTCHTPVPNSFDRGNAFAITGHLLSHAKEHSPAMAAQMFQHGKIFSSMTPQLKADLCHHLKATGRHVCMCGDGSNDCAAFHAANYGLAVSGGDAACVATFASRIGDLSSVIRIIREGRGALSLATQLLKYITLYSAIQMVSVAILASRGLSLSDSQFLWIDFVMIFPISILFTWTRTSKAIVGQAPSRLIACKHIQLNMAGHIIFNVLAQLAGLWLIERVDPEPRSVNLGIFFIASAGTIGESLALSSGKPWRRSCFTNIYLCFYLLLMVILLIAVTTDFKFTWYLTFWLCGTHRLTNPLVRWGILAIEIMTILAALLWENSSAILWPPPKCNRETLCDGSNRLENTYMSSPVHGTETP